MFAERCWRQDSFWPGRSLHSCYWWCRWAATLWILVSYHIYPHYFLQEVSLASKVTSINYLTAMSIGACASGRCKLLLLCMRVAAAAVLAGQLWWLVSQSTPGSKIWSENRSVCSTIIKEEVMNRLRANLWWETLSHLTFTFFFVSSHLYWLITCWLLLMLNNYKMIIIRKTSIQLIHPTAA